MLNTKKDKKFVLQFLSTKSILSVQIPLNGLLNSTIKSLHLKFSVNKTFHFKLKLPLGYETLFKDKF